MFYLLAKNPQYTNRKPLSDLYISSYQVLNFLNLAMMVL